MTIEDLARRFQGVDFKYRRDTGRWDARVVVSKNERAGYRVGAAGRTLDEAITNLLEAVRRVDDPTHRPATSETS